MLSTFVSALPVALVALSALPAAGQELLTYRDDGPARATAAQRAGASASEPGRFDVEVDVGLLRLAPETLLIATPDGHALRAELREFTDRGDGAFLWSGRVAGAEWRSVLFTMAADGLNGIFRSPAEAQYELHANETGAGQVLEAGWLARALQLEDPDLVPLEPGADRPWCVVHQATPDGEPGRLSTRTAAATDDAREPTGAALAASATPGIALSVSPEEVREDAASAVDIAVTATLEGGLAGNDLAVGVSVRGGTAVSGTDFAAVADFTVTIPAGAASGSAVFQFAPTDDDLPEPHESVVVAGSLSGFDVSPAEVEIVSDDVRRIDVIVLYTAPVRNALANANLTPERDARFQFDYATTLLRQAGVAAEYRVVHAGNTPADFDRYIASRAGFAIQGMSLHTRTITRMRDSMNADIVHVMGAGSTLIWHCGQAYGRTSRDWRIEDYGFLGQSVSNLSCAGSRGYRRWMISAHEIGHSLGAFHERGRNGGGDGSVGSGVDEVNDVLAPYAFGYFERANPPFTTTMAYGLAGGQTRLDAYSNVRAKHRGRAMGRPDLNEVERLFRKTAPETADLSDHITPGTPSNFTGQATLNGSAVDIAFTWTDETNREVAQTIQSQIGGTGPWIELARLAPDVETATITGLAPGTRYNFRMYALNALGRGLRTETWSVTTPGTSLPAKPTGLGASTPQPAMARLIWEDNSHNETGFTVEYRAAGAQAWNSAPTVGADVETVDVTNLEHQAEYEFRVGATNSVGTAFSEPVFGLTLPAPPPAAPGGPDPLFGRRLTAASARLWWTDRSTDETGFRVQTRRPGTVSWTVAQSLPADATEAFVTGLESGRHEFRIEATGAGASSISQPIVLDLSVEPPPAIELTGRLLRWDNSWIWAELEWKTVSPFRGEYHRWSKPASEPDGAWSAYEFTHRLTKARHRMAASERIPMQFRIDATNEGGTTMSNVFELDFGSTLPSFPGSVSATMSRPTEVTLTWTEAAGASSYRVWYGDYFNTVEYAIYPADAIRSVVTGLRHGNYNFYVEAVNEDGAASQSSTDFRLRRPRNAPPTPVSHLEVDYPYLRTMRITWRDNSSDEDQFVLSVREDDGYWISFRAAGPDGKTEGGLTVKPSTLYHMRMHADNAANGALNSNIVTFRSTQEPTGVRITPVSSTGVDLSWTDQAIYEQSFQVQVKQAGTPARFRTKTTADRNATTASVDGLAASTSYKFRVRARVVNAAANFRWESSEDVTITMPPPAPSGAAAVAAGSTSATVTWTDESTDETGFVVETRRAGSEWSAAGRAGADEVSADVFGLAPGTTIEFRVRAAHETNGLSSPSDTATLTMPPPPPSGLTASLAGAGSVTLAWTDESTDETGFVVEYKRSGDSNWTTWGTEAPANGQTLTLTGLTAGESYEFRVRARKGTELSSPSAVAVVETIGAPAAASALAATADGATTADLAWTDNASDETGFDVQYRPAGAGAWTTASTVAADSTSAAVTGLSAGRRYEFRVVAKNAHGTTPSGVVALTMPPRAPTGLEGRPDGSTTVELAWTDNARGETGYRVDWRAAGSATWTASPAADPNAGAYTVEGLTASTAWEFRVVALSAAGDSPGATLTLTTPPAPPGGVAVSEAGPTSAALTWTDNSSDETGFVVEYRLFRSRSWTTYATEAAANATTITVAGLASGETYGFRVYAKHGVNGLSSPSDEAVLGKIGGPAAPSAVMATARGSSRAGVSWTDNSSDETGFVVEYRRGSDPWAAIAAAPANATSAEVGPFLGGRTYELRVSSRNALASRPSAGVSLTMPPAAPTGLTAAEAGATSVALSWADESFDETGFVVEYRDSGAQAWTRHGTDPAPNSRSATISGLVQGGTYGFRVLARHATNGMSSPTRVVWVNDLGAPPAGATGVRAAATGSTSVRVTWTDAATDETGFQVRYRPASGAWTTGAAVAPNLELATIGGLSASTVYSFRVIAAGSASSAPSDSFVLTMPPAAPSFLTANPFSGTSVSLAWWDNSSDETSFVVEYRVKGAAAWTLYGTEPPADSVAATVTGLQSGGEYEFRVRAKHGANGLSSPSNVASVAALGPPAAPGSVSASLAGPTSVLVSWKAGSANARGFTVERRPGAGTWTVAVQVLANRTSATVGGLSGSTGYDFRVVAVNSLGTTPSAAVSVTTPPSAPSALSVAEGSSTSVVLSWTDNSPDETGFVAEYRETGASAWTVWGSEASANAVTLTVTGLAAGSSYEFRVKAKNARGSSSPSNVASLTTVPGPAPPSGVSVEATGSTSVTVTWTDNSADETGFTVEYRTGMGSWTQGATAAVDAESTSVSGLSSGASYDFRVLAVNGDGSRPSGTASLTMPPAAPSALSATAESTTSVSLSWTDNSSGETGFAVEYRESGVEVWTTYATEAAANAGTLTVSGLSAGTSYEFRVRARSAHGPSSPSNVASATSLSPPVAPTGVSVTASGSTSVSVSWADASSDETGFVVEYRTGGGSWTSGATLAAGAFSATLTGLAPSTSYEFRVSATNANGSSASSSVSLTMPPAAPSGLSAASSGETAVTLSWTDNSPDETGFVAEYREAGDSAWTAWGSEASANAVTLTVTGLATGSSYEFRVKARSTHGLSSPSNTATATTNRLVVPDPDPDPVPVPDPDPDPVPDPDPDPGPDPGPGPDPEPDPDPGPDPGPGPDPEPDPDPEPEPPANRAPYFAPSDALVLTVAEGAEGAIGSVTARDPDGDDLVYGLRGADAGSFRIGPATAVLSIADGVALDAGVKASHVFEVTASDGLLSASRSVTVEVTPPEPPGDAPSPRLPAPPTGLAASLLTSSVVVLTWTDNAVGETGFDLFQRSGPSAWKALRSVGADVETATVDDLSAGVEYEFVVTAVNGYGAVASNVAAVALSMAPPTHLDALVLGPDRVRVTWRDNSVAEAGFEVQVRPVVQDDGDGDTGEGGGAAAPWRVGAETGPGATEAVLGDLEPGGGYLFRVAALARTGGAGPSSPALSRTAAFTLTAPPEPGTTTACSPAEAATTLSGEYEVRMCFETPTGVWMDASNYHLESRASGLLYFFDRDNVEVLVKVLDGCAINGHRWVFAAPVTTLAFNLEIVERGTGRRFTHRNPKSLTASTVSDTSAFACEDAALSAVASGAASAATGEYATPSAGTGALPVAAADEVPEAPPVCEPEGPGIELDGGYRIDMCFEMPSGEIRQAHDWGLPRRSSALLHFFDRDNPEILIKVLDGCAINGHRWVFAAPATDLGFHLVVTGPEGEKWTHRNAAGRTADPRSDTAAFTCR